jgi:hypothetical protein
MKSIFILALIALTVNSAVAQLDITCGQGYGQCQQQQQWYQNMNTCRALLQQCGRMASFAQSQQASSCKVMRQQCCQQLAQISEQSRCQTVCGVAQAIMQHQFWQGGYQPLQQVQFKTKLMVLQTLPSMCSVYIPDYCTTTPCNIPMAATCAGGAC